MAAPSPKLQWTPYHVCFSRYTYSIRTIYGKKTYLGFHARSPHKQGLVDPSFQILPIHLCFRHCCELPNFSSISGEPIPPLRASFLCQLPLFVAFCACFIVSVVENFEAPVSSEPSGADTLQVWFCREFIDGGHNLLLLVGSWNFVGFNGAIT